MYFIALTTTTLMCVCSAKTAIQINLGTDACERVPVLW